MNGWMPSTIAGWMVVRSRSAKVNTVSKCMAARSFGMPATTIRSAASSAKSAWASWLMACREVRSPMPSSTVPLPTGMTSPPSRWAWLQSFSASPHQIFEPM